MAKTTVTFACSTCTATREDVEKKPAKQAGLPEIADLPLGWAYGRFWFQLPLSGVIREAYVPLCGGCQLRFNAATVGEKFSATAKAEIERLHEGAGETH